jgi:vacuolar-type H+-ATPase catalytic subunit A/Vma1
MSTDFSIRPAGAPASTPVAQPVSQAATSAVATDLPASQTVTAADASAAAGNDLPATNVSISHQAFIDQAAASIVYQVVDTKTDTVVQQYPDEAVLRRRAYFHTLDLTKGEPTRPLATDRTA